MTDVQSAAVENTDIGSIRLTELLMEYSHRMARVRAQTESKGSAGFGVVGVRVLIRLGLVGPMTMGELASHLQVSSARITQVVDVLESQGYVMRCRLGSDRRVWEIHLTASYSERLQEQFGHYMDAVRSAFAGVPEECQPAVMAFVERLVAGSRAD